MRKLVTAAALALSLPFALQAQQWGTWTPGRGAFGDWHWASPVANVTALELVTGAPGECIAVMDAGQVYCWSGDTSEWVSQGGGTDTDDQTAAEVPYTPAVAGDWTDPDPADVAAALDDLAADPGVTDHGALTGLGDDDHSQYALLLGRGGGQTLIGGAPSGKSLSLLANAAEPATGPGLYLNGGDLTLDQFGTDARSPAIFINGPNYGDDPNTIYAWANFLEFGSTSGTGGTRLDLGTNAILRGETYAQMQGGSNAFMRAWGTGKFEIQWNTFGSSLTGSEVTGNLTLVGGNLIAPAFVGPLTGNADTATSAATAATASDLTCTDCIGATEIATLAPADAGLANVTNDAQTKAAVVPNTSPSAGQLLVGNAGGTAYAPQSMSGDATMASTGALTITKADDDQPDSDAEVPNGVTVDLGASGSVLGGGSVSRCARFNASHQLVEASGDCASGDTTGSGALPAGSGAEINARLDASTFQAVTGSSTASGGIALVNQSAAAVPFSVTAAASQSGNLFNVTASGGAAGGIFKINSTGSEVTFQGATVSPTVQLTAGDRSGNSAAKFQFAHGGANGAGGDVCFAGGAGNACFLGGVFGYDRFDFLRHDGLTADTTLYVYNTASGARAASGYANYERMALTGTTASKVTVAAESGGSGSANIDVELFPKGGGDVLFTAANGAVWKQVQTSELLTLSTSGTTTDTTANLLPADCLILSVVARVTTTIATATNWSVGDPTTATRFSSANSTLAAGTTSVGLNHQQGSVTTDAAGPVQTAAAKVRITTTGTPSAGIIRLTAFAECFTAPTS